MCERDKILLEHVAKRTGRSPEDPRFRFQFKQQLRIMGRFLDWHLTPLALIHVEGLDFGEMARVLRCDELEAERRYIASVDKLICSIGETNAT